MRQGQIILILKYLERFQHGLKQWESPGKMAGIIAGLIQN